MKLKEADMNQVVIDYFQSKGYIAFEQVKAGQKRIDLYFVNRNYPKTIAVELKIRKWKDVFIQALQNRNYAQKSYIGMWHDYLNEEKNEIFREHGIGILKIFSDRMELVSLPGNDYTGITPSVEKILLTSCMDQEQFLWSD